MITLLTRYVGIWEPNKDKDATGYVAELSDLGAHGMAHNSPVGTVVDTPCGPLPLRIFTPDMNGDEIAGWRYTDEATGGTTLLVIND